MVDLASLGSDVVTGATALGGLQLVFLGSVVSDYGSFETEAQHSVVSSHRLRAWQAAIGVVTCLLAAMLSLYGKWGDLPFMTYASVLVLTESLLAAGFLALKMAMDVR